MSTSETRVNGFKFGETRPNADQVAAVVAGISTIGEAALALSAAGWQSKIAGNRISVNDRVFVRYINETARSNGSQDARWVVYGVGDRPVVRIVAGE